MNKKICIFLGYSPKKTKIINKIKKKYIKSWEIKYIKKKISLKAAKESDLIISYGYRHIFTNSFLKKVSAPIINLHISFLPFNRGAHPNFWSFVENTPKLRPQGSKMRGKYPPGSQNGAMVPQR